MTNPVPTPPTPAPQPAPPAPAPSPAPAPTQPAPPVQPPAGDGWDMASLPQGAQDYIRSLRGEAANNRTGRTQAEQQMQATLDAITQHLGLNQAPADPAALTAQLQHSQAEARQRQIELAVWQNAAGAQADPGALMDSRKFMDAAHGLDPAAQDFGTKLADLIKQSVTADARLKAQGGTPSFDGGTRTSGTPNLAAEQAKAQLARRFPQAAAPN